MNIIAVDDEKLALDTLVDSVEKVLPEANVNGFRNPQEALGYVQGKHCEIAFLDIKMRGISGLELARQLKNIQGDINIVFVTGYSEYALDAFRLYASDYLLKPATPEAVEKALQHLRTPVKPKNGKKIRFQCFGTFEVFFCEKCLVFKRSKAKELLAYLVDRMGASVTMGELMSVLWEDGQDTVSRRSNLRNLISDIKQTLVEAGSEDIIVKGRNTIAIDCNAVDCDLYNFLRHIPYAVNSYRGEYMTQYSWAEITTASLTQLK
jgi:two-component system LytT family response regulator